MNKKRAPYSHSDGSNCWTKGCSRGHTRVAPNRDFPDLIPATKEELEQKFNETYASEARSLRPPTQPALSKKVNEHTGEIDYKNMKNLSPIGVMEYLNKFPEQEIRWPQVRKLTFSSYEARRFVETARYLTEQKVPHVITPDSIEVSTVSKKQLKQIIQLELQDLVNVNRLAARIDDKKIKQPIKDVLKRTPKPTPNADSFEETFTSIQKRAARSGITVV